MDVFEAIKNRYSVRSYKATSIPEEKLKKILEAVRLAPSAHNSQDWKFIVVKDAKKRKEVSEAVGQGFIAEAPVIIAGVSLAPENILRSKVPTYAVDLAIAMEHIALQAVEEGLGTCWIGAFSQEEVKKVLNIPEKFKVVALMPLGFPAEKPSPKDRKSLKEITCENTFRG